MDTVTHSIIGALVARSRTEPGDKAALSQSKRVLVVALAAAFPDLDYLSFWGNPYLFITQWHRGISHSLLMLPLWSVILGLAFSAILGQKRLLPELTKLSALGLLSHIAMDVITVYGTQILAPIYQYRAALFLTFDIDIWITVIACGGLAASLYRQSWTRWGILCLAAYIVLQVFLRQAAFSVAQEYVDRQNRQITRIAVLPQPISPFHKKLVVEDKYGYSIAHLNLAGMPYTLIRPGNGILPNALSTYLPPQQLVWRKIPRMGATLPEQHLAMEVWRQTDFSRFRRFAIYPVVYRVDSDRFSKCVWFSDLRYMIPDLTPPFRYGMCKSSNLPCWRLFRLRRYTHNSRQSLGP